MMGLFWYMYCYSQGAQWPLKCITLCCHVHQVSPCMFTRPELVLFKGQYVIVQDHLTFCHSFTKSVFFYFKWRECCLLVVLYFHLPPSLCQITFSFEHAKVRSYVFPFFVRSFVCLFVFSWIWEKLTFMFLLNILE